MQNVYNNSKDLYLINMKRMAMAIRLQIVTVKFVLSLVCVANVRTTCALGRLWRRVAKLRQTRVAEMFMFSFFYSVKYISAKRQGKH